MPCPRVSEPRSAVADPNLATRVCAFVWSPAGLHVWLPAFLDPCLKLRWFAAEPARIWRFAFSVGSSRCFVMASALAVDTPATELDALDTECKAVDVDVEEKATAAIVEADSEPAPSELRAWLVVLGTLCVWPMLAR